MTLIERARRFVESGNPRELPQLLMDCVEANNNEGLLAVRLLARDMYGGETFNMLLKGPAAHCLLAWGQAGLEALVENTLEEPTSKNFSLAFQLLACIAEGNQPQSIGSLISDDKLQAAISGAVGDWRGLALGARGQLHELNQSHDEMRRGRG